jgi:hypothetical protein
MGENLNFQLKNFRSSVSRIDQMAAQTLVPESQAPSSQPHAYGASDGLF